jgi:hypothetical protein
MNVGNMIVARVYAPQIQKWARGGGSGERDVAYRRQNQRERCGVESIRGRGGEWGGGGEEGVTMVAIGSVAEHVLVHKQLLCEKVM